MEPLIPGYYYHIYNHANSNEELFLNDRNNYYFLKQYRKYINPIAETLAYCLMPNHFHFLVRFKEMENEIPLEENKANEFIKLKTHTEKEEFLSLYFSKQFSNLFSSYTQAFNKENSRRGSLFIKNFKRKKLTDEKYFIRLINYIHFNPVIHGFVEKPSYWKYSSFNAIISTKETLINRTEVLEWFGGLDNFNYCHRSSMDI